MILIKTIFQLAVGPQLDFVFDSDAVKEVKEASSLNEAVTIALEHALGHQLIHRFFSRHVILNYYLKQKFYILGWNFVSETLWIEAVSRKTFTLT